MMIDIQSLLSDAEKAWRDDVRTYFPRRSNTQVVRKKPPLGRDWMFGTNLKDIFASIAEENSLEEKFNDIVTQYWKGEPNDLLLQTLHYLLHHEIYHPIEAPFSTEGQDNDNKMIHQSIRKGVLEAEPDLSALEQLTKVSASQNGVKDFILDNRFYLDNMEREYVRDDIIPVWDMLELQDAQSKTTFFTVTRLLYGLMYGPESTHEFFRAKSGEDGTDVAEQSLAALLETYVSLKPPVQKRRWVSITGKDKKKKEREEIKAYHEKIQAYTKAIRDVFRGDDRYEGVRRMMAVLGPYVTKDMQQGNSDMQGEGSGGSPQDILQDLLDDMDSEEQQQFLQDLAQEDQNDLENLSQQFQDEGESDEIRNLDILAAHEFYRRNHPKVTIIGGKKIGEKVTVGKRYTWDVKRSTTLTEDQMGNLNLNRINELQNKTGLPWLIDLGNGRYRLTEYEVKEENVHDVIYVDSNINVPDIVEFYIDSSGSMFNFSAGEYQVDDGSRWDMLSHVFYGFVDALQQGSRKAGKICDIRLHNFAEGQVSSEAISVDRFWKGDTQALEMFFRPNNGYCSTRPCIQDNKRSGKSAYVICTDGAVENSDREADTIRYLAKERNNDVVVFEIGGTYDLGNTIMNDRDIAYHRVHDKEEMLRAGIDVLLSR